MTDHWEGVAAVQWVLPHILLTWNVIIIGHLTKFNKLFPKRPINHLGDTLTLCATRDQEIEVYFIHKTDTGTPYFWYQCQRQSSIDYSSPILSVVSKGQCQCLQTLVRAAAYGGVVRTVYFSPRPLLTVSIPSSSSNHVVKYELCSA